MWHQVSALHAPAPLRRALQCTMKPTLGYWLASPNTGDYRFRVCQLAIILCDPEIAIALIVLDEDALGILILRDQAPVPAGSRAVATAWSRRTAKYSRRPEDSLSQRAKMNSGNLLGWAAASLHPARSLEPKRC